MTQKFYLVKDCPPNPGEYITAPGYFRATQQPEKLTQANMAAVGDRDYTTDRAKAYVAILPESTSPDYEKEFDVLHVLALAHSCKLEAVN